MQPKGEYDQLREEVERFYESYAPDYPKPVSDDQHARGRQIFPTGQVDVGIEFSIPWLTEAMAAGVIGNIAYALLVRIINKLAERKRDEYPAKIPVSVRKRADAEVWAKLTVQARCAERGLTIPNFSSFDVKEVKFTFDRDLGCPVWQVLLRFKEMSAEVAIAGGDLSHQSIPVKIWGPAR